MNTLFSLRGGFFSVFFNTLVVGLGGNLNSGGLGGWLWWGSIIEPDRIWLIGWQQDRGKSSCSLIGRGKWMKRKTHKWQN